MNTLLADNNAERAGAIARVLTAGPGLIVLHLRPNEALAEAVAALLRRLSEPDACNWLSQRSRSRGRRIADDAAKLVRETGGSAK